MALRMAVKESQREEYHPACRVRAMERGPALRVHISKVQIRCSVLANSLSLVLWKFLLHFNHRRGC